METFAVTALLITALALPVVLFLLLRLRSRLSSLTAAAIAVAAGWAFNLVYAFVTQEITAKDPSQANDGSLAIAAMFGWACPTVLVLLTWLVLRFATRRKNTDDSPPQNGAS